MTENKLLNEFLDINKKPLDEKGYFYDMDLAFMSVNIAEDFAIAFAEWLVIQYNEDSIYPEYTTKELLEIYKKNDYD